MGARSRSPRQPLSRTRGWAGARACCSGHIACGRRAAPLGSLTCGGCMRVVVSATWRAVSVVKRARSCAASVSLQPPNRPPPDQSTSGAGYGCRGFWVGFSPSVGYDVRLSWLGLSPSYPPKGWGSVATPPPKPHWGGADSHVIWPGVCPGLTRKSSSVHAWPACYTSYGSHDL